MRTAALIHRASPTTNVRCGAQLFQPPRLQIKGSGGIASRWLLPVPMPTTKHLLHLQLLAIPDPWSLEVRSMLPTMPRVRTHIWATNIIRSVNTRVTIRLLVRPTATPKQLTTSAILQQMARTRLAASSMLMFFQSTVCPKGSTARCIPKSGLPHTLRIMGNIGVLIDTRFLDRTATP